LSIKYATPLHLEFKSSKLFGFYVYFVFFISLFSIYLLPITLSIKLLLIAICVVACLHVYRSSSKLQSIVWQEGNHWLLNDDNETLVAELDDTSFAISWLLILNFKTDTGARCSKLVCYDSLDSNIFRQLKVRLKVERLNNKLHAKMST